MDRGIAVWPKRIVLIINEVGEGDVVLRPFDWRIADRTDCSSKLHESHGYSLGCLVWYTKPPCVAEEVNDDT